MLGWTYFRQTAMKLLWHFSAFLVDKLLNGFDRRTGKLLAQVGDGTSHPVEEMSSGEKQALLMLVTIMRWLRSGGIVLSIEPDLHLHVSLDMAFVSHLRPMANRNNGQLITASRVPAIWKGFADPHRALMTTPSTMG